MCKHSQKSISKTGNPIKSQSNRISMGLSSYGVINFTICFIFILLGWIKIVPKNNLNNEIEP